MRCSHGEFEDEPSGEKRVRGAAARASTEHEKKCSNANLFVHSGWIFNLLCCAGCGRKVASF